MEKGRMTIGELSELSMVPASTLRYYDERDLFKPEYTDYITGYRYYEPQQLFKLNCILAWRKLGYSLKDIRRILSLENLDDLDGEYRTQQNRIQSKIDQLMEIQQHLKENQQTLKGCRTMVPLSSGGLPELVTIPQKTYLAIPYSGELDRVAYRFYLSRMEQLVKRWKLTTVNHVTILIEENPSRLFFSREIETAISHESSSTFHEKDHPFLQLPGSKGVEAYIKGTGNTVTEQKDSMDRWMEREEVIPRGMERWSFLMDSQILMNEQEYIRKVEIPIE